jgi:hypothetical protein
MWHDGAVMKFNRVSASILPFVLASSLLAGGCKKQSQPATSETPQAVPAPADSSAAASPAPAPSSAAGPASSAAPAPAPPSTPDASAAPEPGAATTEAGPPPPPPPPPVVVIPAGTHIAVTISQDLGSKISQEGQTFSAVVATPVRVGGVTVIRAGASATGTVIDAKALGRFKGGAELGLRLDTVRASGATYQVASSTITRTEAGKGKRTAGFIGGGAGGGALIGGLAGGGKGALIGGLIGAGAGTVGAGFTGKKDIVIPAETTLTFRLERAVHVTQSQ